MVIASRTTDTVSKRDRADVLASCRNIFLAGHSTGISKAFAAHQIPKGHRACTQRGVAIVGLGGRERDRFWIDRAGSIAGVGDVVVGGYISTTTVQNRQATGANSLVRATDVLVGECLGCGCTYRLACSSACQCTNCGAACCGGVAIVGFGDLRCRYRQIGLRDVGAGCGTARHQRVVAQVCA